MFESPTQLLSMVLEIANVWVMYLIKQDDDDTNQQISNGESEDPGEFTLLSDMTEDDLDNWQEVLHLGQVRPDKALQTTRVPLPKKQSHADSIVTRTPPRNLGHPAGP
jgi:hypothetical protein